MIMFYYDSFNIYSKIKILNIVFLSKIMKEIKVKRIINNVLNEYLNKNAIMPLKKYNGIVNVEKFPYFEPFERECWVKHYKEPSDDYANTIVITFDKERCE